MVDARLLHVIINRKLWKYHLESHTVKSLPNLSTKQNNKNKRTKKQREHPKFTDKFHEKYQFHVTVTHNV